MNYFSGMNKLPVVIISIFTFVFFEKINLSEKKIINKLANNMFGVYLIHENIYIREIMWNFQSNLIGNSSFFIGYTILFSIMLIIICSLIDTVFSILINYLVKKVDKFNNYIKYKNIESKYDKNSSS